MVRPRVWTVVLVIGLVVGGACSAPRPANPASEGQAAVAALTRRGVLRGYPQGKYEPDKPVTRLELAIVLARFLRAIESNPAAAQRPAPARKAARLPAGIPRWARADFTYLARRGYVQTHPQLCRDLSKPIREKDLVAVLTWAVTSLAQRGYIPPGDLAPPPKEPEPKL